MPDKTGIQWADATWNPITGCSKVSPGCAHCYAETVARRFPEKFTDDGIFRPWTPSNTGHNVLIHEDRLDQPLRWTRPRMVFVNSMSDLFHEDVPFSFIDRVFEVMAQADRHVFQVLTKRPERMLAYFERAADHMGLTLEDLVPWPNVWLGVSIENDRFIGRADTLRATPAAVRFISAEPLLGELVHWEDGYQLTGSLSLRDIDWVIVGGESGANARRMDPKWALSILDAASDEQCAFFFKQLGTVTASDLGAHGKGSDPEAWPEALRLRQMPSPAAAAATADAPTRRTLDREESSADVR